MNSIIAGITGIALTASAAGANFANIIKDDLFHHFVNRIENATTTPWREASSTPMHPPFPGRRATSTPPMNDDGPRDASSSLEHMPQVMPHFPHASISTTTWTGSSTAAWHASTTPEHPMPSMGTTTASSTHPVPPPGFWRRVFNWL